MPYIWVKPDLFFHYKGVNIYHAYKDDTDYTLYYHYTTCEHEDPEYRFDARDLPEVKGATVLNKFGQQRIIKNALNLGLVRLPEGVIYDPEAKLSDDSVIAKCDNCAHIFSYTEDDLAKIPDLLQRIMPGGIVPAAVCPKCGCLAYPFEGTINSFLGQESASPERTCV